MLSLSPIASARAKASWRNAATARCGSPAGQQRFAQRQQQVAALHLVVWVEHLLDFERLLQVTHRLAVGEDAMARWAASSP